MAQARCRASIDDHIGRALAYLHAARACVVAIANDTPVRWHLEAVRIARGDFVAVPPATIEPWSAAACSARNGRARPGAGCAGSARYRSSEGEILDVRFDVPYAGSALAEIEIGGGPPAGRGYAVRRPAGATVVFRLPVPAGSDLVSTILRKATFVMSDQTRSGGTVRPQSVVGPIALDETHAGAPVPVQPNSVVGPVALGLVEPVAVVAAACSAAAVTLTVESGGKHGHVIVTVPASSGAPAVAVPAGATLQGIARSDTDLVIALEGAAPQALVTLPVAASDAVTVTVKRAPAI